MTANANSKRLLAGVRAMSAGASSRPPEAPVHSLYQLLRVQRLPQQAREVGAVQIVEVRTRDHDDWDLARLRVRLELPLDVASPQTWKPKVEHDCVRHVTFNCPKRVDSVLDGNDRIACSGQRVPVEVA